MTDYLDKGAVLKAISKGTWAFPPYTLANFFEQLQCGEFDAIPAGSALVSSCLADKDAKIAALQKRCDNDRELATTHLKMFEEKNAEIARLKNQCDNYHEAIGVFRENKDKEIWRLNETLRTTAHCHGELQREMFKQRDRIAQQDQELKDLGKALQEARETIARYSKKCMTLQKEQKKMRDPERQIVCDILANGFTMQRVPEKEPPKDEPELWICPNVGASPDCKICHIHSKPHPHNKGCDFSGTTCKACIPYKKPTVPQEPASVPKTDMDHL